MIDLWETEILDTIIPAPVDMLAVFLLKDRAEHKTPVIAQAVIIKDHFTHSTRFVVALVIDCRGEYRIANRIDSFDRLESQTAAASQCSMTSKAP